MSTKVNKVTAAGLLVALGIIYGDIGTSPLYVFNAIINSKEISELLVVGGLYLDTNSSDNIKVCSTYIEGR